MPESKKSVTSPDAVEETVETLAQVEYLESESLTEEAATPAASAQTTLSIETERTGGEHDFAGWWLPLLAAVIGILVLDWGATWLGGRLYWTEQALYLVSLALIFVTSIITAGYIIRHGHRLRDIFIMNGLMALAAGIVLSVVRFVSDTAFWTFFNLIAQPVNALILSIFGTWIASVLVGARRSKVPPTSTL